MSMGHNRFKKPDILLVLAVLVGVGAVVSTSAQAEEPAESVPAALLVSYQGALPALKARLARVADQTGGLLRQVGTLVPSEDRITDLVTPSPEAPEQVYLTFEAPTPRSAAPAVVDEQGFVVEQAFIPTLVFQRRW